ncbi:MAG: hypothetical protein KGZ25_12695, partial [Planctomycetes bacterium]|nr:hypothetical protein [Planctomycetota bacterium]
KTKNAYKRLGERIANTSPRVDVDGQERGDRNRTSVDGRRSKAMENFAGLLTVTEAGKATGIDGLQKQGGLARGTTTVHFVAPDADSAVLTYEVIFVDDVGKDARKQLASLPIGLSKTKVKSVGTHGFMFASQNPDLGTHRMLYTWSKQHNLRITLQGFNVTPEKLIELAKRMFQRLEK